MKRFSALLTATVAASVVIGLLLQTIRLMSERREVERRRQVLPDVQLVDLTGEAARVGGSSGRSTVLVFFTTTCGYCRAELAEFTRRAATFRSVEVVFVSPEDRLRLRAFLEAFRRETTFVVHPPFRVLSDTAAALFRHFDVRHVPTILVYGPDGLLKDSFDGAAAIDRIAAAARSQAGAP